MRLARWRGGWSVGTRRAVREPRPMGRSCAVWPGICGWAGPGGRCLPALCIGVPPMAGSGAGGHGAYSTSCWAVLLRQVARRRRRALGRKPEPGLAIIDTQSLACLPVRGPRGYDAATKGLGRKRVALVDAEGLWLAVAVVRGGAGQPSGPGLCGRANARSAGLAEPARGGPGRGLPR